MKLLLSSLAVLSAILPAQIKITSVEVIPLTGRSFGYARFSPDGSKLFVSTLGYDGIWEYSFATRSSRTITEDRGSGYNFAVSPDGKTISYRRTLPGSTSRTRKQEVVSRNLSTGATESLGSARSVSTPVYDGSSIAFMSGPSLVNPQPSKNRVTLVGIDAQKIVLLVNGQKRILDPLGNGSYIWPALSPDRSRIVAYEMDRGTFVCDNKGVVAAKLGRVDGPSWTRDGKWIVGFVEVNDGHDITGSELYAVRPDGTGNIPLTNTSDRVELFPSCSPVDNRIACHTKDGKIVVLSYEVIQ